jgi:replicative superfamily II helicase
VSATLYDLIPRDGGCGNDALLGRFLDYVEGRRLRLYPAQETAVLELFEDKNVILNTPTGSGKSLVAAAAQFKALARGEHSVYTCPIKALVNEKWLALCREFGPENVGLSTGDASVNRDAPVLCCTAEILANIALREGAQANVQEVIMDEFHYYADRERRAAWQIPLCTMPRARFLLMSATLGGTADRPRAQAVDQLLEFGVLGRGDCRGEFVFLLRLAAMSARVRSMTCWACCSTSRWYS